MALAVYFVAIFLAAPGPSLGQEAPPPPVAAPDPAAPHGQVIFSRSAADSTQDSRSPVSNEAASPALAESVTDAMRTSVAFTAYDFTIHLQPETASLQVELRATLRNTGSAPLAALPLQLSSSLHFEHVRSSGLALPFATHRLQSDADHTGALVEAAVALPKPLAPGAEQSFTIDYAGAIPSSSTRLDRLGTPASQAAEADWDRISESFTGLRGFGNTVWYPVASQPALLGDGARLFTEIGRQKQGNSAARVSMAITVEFTGDAPNLAVLDGHPTTPGEPASLPTASFPGVLRVLLPPTTLGFATPSLVLAAREEALTNGLISVAALPVHVDAAVKYRAAADLLQPLFADWLGDQPLKPLLLLDLPVDGAAPSDDGDALLLSLSADAAPSRLAGSLAGALAHVYFHSPRPWLREGVGGLMGVLWTERTEGRSRALEQLGAGRGALAIAEPPRPAEGGEPLIAARDEVFYRTKATFVLWMLRTLAGDAALAGALESYDPEKDTAPGYFESVLAQSVTAHPPTGGVSSTGGASPAPEAAGPGSAGLESAPAAATALHSFFETWVYGDPGLPDLAIANVFSSRTAPNSEQWLVAVQVSNAGYADANVPVTVRSASSSVTVQVRVPARGTLARRILLLGEPTEVDVNDGSVPEVQASVHRRVLQ